MRLSTLSWLVAGGSVAAAGDLHPEGSLRLAMLWAQCGASYWYSRWASHAQIHTDRKYLEMIQYYFHLYPKSLGLSQLKDANINILKGLPRLIYGDNWDFET